ncbi:hypothetical protein DEO72_LG2g1058 [Vigna unguiculata]|uniref:Uncharacterized protein n=1 Tax=Vigna unguiculata TaxID=3917 RepID=A0A4D6KRQ1_VIGUN|nr:hypothetical protein DEO72_LG2g1058 [Vigna unguiculata]
MEGCLVWLFGFVKKRFCEAQTGELFGVWWSREGGQRGGGVSGVGGGVSGDNGRRWFSVAVRFGGEVFWCGGGTGGTGVVLCAWGDGTGYVDVVVFEVAGGRAWRRSCQCGGEGGRSDVRRVCLKVEASGVASCSVIEVLAGGEEALRGVRVRQSVCW